MSRDLATNLLGTINNTVLKWLSGLDTVIHKPTSHSNIAYSLVDNFINIYGTLQYIETIHHHWN